MSQNQGSLPQRCEVAVIGSGPGGATTAALLAEAGLDVILLEEGKDHRSSNIERFSVDEMQAKYRHGGISAAMGKTKVTYVEGRLVGGGSEVNSGLYHRTPSEVLEHWKAEGVEGLDARTLEPIFTANETDLDIQTMPEGMGSEASSRLERGARAKEWEVREIPRWYSYPSGKPRANTMSSTMIPRFEKAGGKLFSRCQALRLKQSGKFWQVQVERQGVRSWIEAGTVFVCAGAIQTPKLLLRSGIRSNIGNRLQMHPTIKVTALFDEEVNSLDMGVPVHQVREFAPKMSFGCSISKPPFLAAQTLGFRDEVEVRESWKRMATYYAMIEPTGRGRVSLLPFFEDPLVRFPLSGEDLWDLGLGLYRLCDMLFEGGAKTLFPTIQGARPIGRGDPLKPEALPAGLSQLMTIHLFSSCPMGGDPKLSATDSWGRVWGHKGLHINDASLLCSAPGVNPQGTIMALARRNTMKFLGRLS